MDNNHNDAHKELVRVLRDGGMPAWRIRRTLVELQEHCEDIEAEALAAGLTAHEARAEARARLGETEVLAQAFLSAPELNHWPLTAQLSGMAVLAGDVCSENSPTVMRWSMAITTAALGTTAFLFCLHLVLFS